MAIILALNVVANTTSFVNSTYPTICQNVNRSATDALLEIYIYICVNCLQSENVLFD